MRALLLLALLAACDASCPETKIPATGLIHRGVFVEDGDYMRVASAVGGNIVREDCDRNLRLLGPDFMTARTVDLGYQYKRDRSVLALVRATDGGIAAVTWELDYASNDNELSRLRLVMIAPAGNVVWTKLLAKDEASPPEIRVAIGWDQVFVVEHNFALTAYSRASGEVAWQQTVSGTTFPRAELVAQDSGDVVMTVANGVAAYTPAGMVRWQRTPDAFGMDAVANVAVALDGTVAAVGETGATQRVALVAPDGALLWSHELGNPSADRVSSIVTDGVRVVAAGDFTGQLSFDPSTRNDDNTDGFIVSVDAKGIEGVQVAGGAGTQNADVVTLYGPASVIVRVRNFVGDPAPEIRVGGVEIAGAGMAIVDFDHL
jgi:hypothetical protein